MDDQKYSPPPSAADAVTEHHLKPSVSAKPSSEAQTLLPSTHDERPINAGTSVTRERPIKKLKKKNKLSTFPASSSSSASSSSNFTQRGGVRVSRRQRNPRVLIGSRQRNPMGGDVEALALPLGMSIAAVVAQVLERKESTGEVIAADNLSEICILAVKESLANVFGDKFDLFVKNFEKSFRSTLMTLRLIHESSRCTGEHPKGLPEKNNNCSSLVLNKEMGTTCSSGVKDCHSDAVQCTCSSEDLPDIPKEIGAVGLPEKKNNLSSSSSLVPNKENGTTCSSGVRDCHSDAIQSTCSSEDLPGILKEIIAVGRGPRDEELTMLDEEVSQVACVSSGTMHSVMKNSVMNTFEKSVIEQTRANDLKKFEIGLTMRKLQIKEKQLALSSDLNSLERRKLSMGISKASFKAEKFKTELEETRHGELLKKCTDSLVAGMLVMLTTVGYGTYIYSHDKLTEATSSCWPAEESKSWWIPKPMSSFNSGLQILWCQVQVVSRMLFGVLMILAITYLLLQRSAMSTRTMPITFILLLGVACGFAGKLCIDTLGGNGYYWLVNWEAMCLLHFYSNVCTSALFNFLHGPITMTKDLNGVTLIPYWVRRILFYATLLVLLPLLCGLVPFAALSEWKDHFSSQAMDFLQLEDFYMYCIKRVLYYIAVLLLMPLPLGATVLCKLYLSGKVTSGLDCSSFLYRLLGWAAMRLAR